ncbi:MAG: GNAT family N-acetyltransferase [bacterium]|nr:GNAT family N-acetyltransferase [bacterium]
MKESNRIEKGQWYALSEFSAETWNCVPSNSRMPMQHYIWARACEEAFATPEGVRVATVGPRECYTAIAPLAAMPSCSGYLSLLGAEDLWESGEVLYADETALDSLARELVGSGRPIRFGHYPGDSPFISVLRRAYRGRGFVLAKPLEQRGMPFITLSAGWTDPESQLSSRRRGDLRRMRRRAEQRGTLKINIDLPLAENLERLLDEAFAVESDGWKGRSGTAIAFDKRLERFFRCYAELALRAGILRLCFLRIDGLAAAVQIAVECDGGFWLLKVGYRESFRQCSPGNLLMRESIRHAAEQGLRSFEFLGKESPWTQAWTSHSRPLVRLRTYPVSLAGMGALARDGFRSTLKAIVNRLPRAGSKQ